MERCIVDNHSVYGGYISLDLRLVTEDSGEPNRRISDRSERGNHGQPRAVLLGL